MTTALQYRKLKVGRILLGALEAKLDSNLVFEIAESMKVHGQVQPIAVRPYVDDRTEEPRYVLLDGAQRLAATKLTGGKLIDCIVFETNDADARMIQIAQNLFRKHLTVLTRAELFEEWLVHASSRLTISGQVVRKKGRGRPSGGAALAASGLPCVGRTKEARRKLVERASKIANISPEAKAVIRKAKLDNNQRAMLAIAKLPKVSAQVEQAAEFARQARATNAPSVGRLKDVASRRQGSSIDHSDEGDRHDRTRSKGEGVSRGETTFLELEAFWDKHGQKLWAYATAETRKRFFEKLSRSVCRARPDVAKLVQDAMRGRQALGKADLVALGTAKGLSKKRVLKAAQTFYQSKRTGHGYNGIWHFVNSDKEWKSRTITIREAEFTSARQALADAEMHKPKPFGDGANDPYYKGLSGGEANGKVGHEKKDDKFKDLKKAFEERHREKH